MSLKNTTYFYLAPKCERQFIIRTVCPLWMLKSLFAQFWFMFGERWRLPSTDLDIYEDFKHVIFPFAPFLLDV